MKQFRNIFWGLVLIIIGLIIGLNGLGVTNINLFFKGWWTLFIIVPCFIDLFNDKDKIGDVIGIVVGILLLLGCYDLFSFDILLKLLLPIILIIIGLSLIFKNNTKVKTIMKKLEKENGKTPEYCATFGENNASFDEEEFTGCNIDAIFGGVKLDLKNAKIKKDVVINATSIFGGVTIITPDDVNVKINSTPIFGGVEDERRKSKKEANEKKLKTIYINATCVFGGVSLK